MKIRNIEINNGTPAVCVPVTDEGRDDIISHVREISGQADIVEWRMDFFDEVRDQAALHDIVTAIREAAGDTVLLATLRTQREGGEFSGDTDEYLGILNTCVDSGCVDIIDAEYSAFSDAPSIFRSLQRNGVRLIASHHDFHETPDEKDMYEGLERMADSGADIVKLAVMPATVHDVLSLLSVTYRFHALHPIVPLVTMSMGKLGVISRIAGGTFGSCITFGADRVASAPGQLGYSELKQIIRILDEAGR